MEKLRFSLKNQPFLEDKERNCINRENYVETVKLIEKMTGGNAFVYGTVTAFQRENRTVKVQMEPSGIETGWCRCLQGAYADKIGMEVLLGRVAMGKTQRYVVLGILE